MAGREGGREGGGEAQRGSDRYDGRDGPGYAQSLHATDTFINWLLTPYTTVSKLTDLNPTNLLTQHLPTSPTSVSAYIAASSYHEAESASSPAQVT